MNTWFLFAIISQFLFAVCVLTDRFIVSKGVVSKPVVYAFYVSFMSVFALGALPFGVSLPSGQTTLLSLGVAITYLISIIFLYESLKNANPTEVAPVVGGVAAITSFVGSMLLLGTTLPTHFIWGFSALVIGMVLISHFNFSLRSFFFLTGSGIFFGLSSVLIKMIFVQDTLVNGFFWSRMANVVVALALLLIPSVYSSIRSDWGKPNKGKKSALLIGNKILGALGFVFTLVAIKLGDVAIVNALSATQYLFLLIFAIFFGNLLPEYFKETGHKHEIIHKLAAVTFIVIGFFVLFLD